MTRDEYEQLQFNLSQLYVSSKLHVKNITGKRAEGYSEGVRAAKSVLANFARQNGILLLGLGEDD